MKKSTRARCGFMLLLWAALFSPPLLAQQQISVSGKVTDTAGAALASVTVLEKGTSNSVATASDGSFTIRVRNSNATLVFTSVGYLRQEIRLNGRTTVSVTMAADPQSLEGVVVVGYGTQKKSDVTGSLVSISAETVRERPAQSVLQAIQGKAAGVAVSSNMKPGELPVVRIRGNRSIDASNDPLYVVDGIPIVNVLNVNSFTINDINPNDIASIEILKDASATAIYGSRGANGVVLITTNKAKKGRTSINFTSTVSLDRYKALSDWMDGGEYIDRWRLSLINGRMYKTGLPGNDDFNKPAIMWYPDPDLDKQTMLGSADPATIENVMMGYEWNEDGTVKMRPTTPEEQAMGWPAMVPVYNSRNIRSFDWLDAATRTGITQNHSLSVSAGNEVARIAISLGYYKQLGVQRDQDFNRYTVNINGDIAATRWFTLGTSVMSAFSIQDYGIQGYNISNTGSKDLYSRAAEMFPFAMPKDLNGNWMYNPGDNINNNLWNPLIDIDNSKNERRAASVLANVFAEIRLAPWLRYRVNFGPQYRRYRSGSWKGPLATPHLSAVNSASYYTEENFSWVVENLLYIDKQLGKDHKLGVTLLQSAQQSRRENATSSTGQLTNPVSLWYDLASNISGNPVIRTEFTENTLVSFMARANYSFKDKYLLTISGRADGASVLAPGNKWDFFPSLAVAWKMQEEPFLQPVTWIQELKPRIGYGVTGNSSVSPYTTSGPLSRNTYVFGSTPAIAYLPQLAKNPLLKWEQTTQTNVGLDFTLLNGRLSGSFEYYVQETSDLIFRRSMPPGSGYVEKYENVGKTKNQGVEITLSVTPVRTSDWNWTVDLNWAKNKEEIVELVNGKEDMVSNNLFIGYPTSVYRQYQFAGIWGYSSKDLEEMEKFNTTGNHRFYPGTVRVVDQNNDYKIDGQDLVILGSRIPDWSGGITNTVNYKNWTFNMFIYFRWGQTYFGGYPGSSYGGNGGNGRVENDVWSWDNPGGRWPMPNFGNVENISSAMQYNDGSFGIVRNIGLSYAFPSNKIGRTGLKNLVLNVQVLNPFLFGPGIVKYGINPDDDTEWHRASTAPGNPPLGGTNNNTVLTQSIVFGLRAGF